MLIIVSTLSSTVTGTAVHSDFFVMGRLTAAAGRDAGADIE
jgi:hypothetical protein